MEDTGSPLKWRHLHAKDISDLSGILQWTGDQHGGQAKGLGLHLRRLSQQLPDRYDLHQPHRKISELDEYDHLCRVFRLCAVHVLRNIKICSVDESVKNMMRSLICIEHRDFEGTLQRIQANGGKAGSDWVEDKVRSRFALPGICWSLSYIPRIVWKNGDSNSNIIEALHSDVNSEGRHCSLVSGVKKGFHFDLMKSQSLKVWLSQIAPTPLD
ncbi:hypothetical protein PAXINDRAFT_20171 [Paxillus involutus ATCC 200175]|uniref:Uncharacterized protein n=1 Tax=Paxillus involutus ATCC 200175 TaxID=664439 RepID=A0A0C9T5S7_PAXIN|nr:hypothetical protein PAXINDRAFT_20171 [Paxillus involutus ATCC 200175]